MKILIFLLFITYSLLTKGQTVSSSGRTINYSGKGIIDENYFITFELDEIIRPYYVNQCYNGEERQFIGRYYYDKFEKYVNLAGTKLSKWDEIQKNDTITLFEFDNNFNKVAVFKGSFIDNKFIGVWNRLNDTNILNFSINIDSKKFTELNVSTSKGVFPLPIEHDNKFNQNEFEVLSVIEFKETTYVLLKLSLTQCFALNCRGRGCGGINEYLKLYEINGNNYKISEFLLKGFGYNGYPRDMIEEKVDLDSYKAKIRQYKVDSDTITYYLISVNLKDLKEGIKEIKL